MVDMSISLEPQTFVVTTPGDPGNGVCNVACTLREAINAANQKPGADIISFNIASGGVQTIALTSGLPGISDPVTIDGYTQPGASPNTLAVGNNAVLLIELNGSGAGSANGLIIRASHCTVRGLVINRVAYTGIHIQTVGFPSTNNVIEGNFIGTDPGGTLDLGNGLGVAISAPRNTLGGTTPAARNLISGTNDGYGVFLEQVTGDAQNLVKGNYIGTDKNGTAALANSYGGIYVESEDNHIGGAETGAGNLISGNGGSGIEIKGAAGEQQHGARQSDRNERRGRRGPWKRELRCLHQ